MIYKVVSENLGGLGGPMGTEETWNNWEVYFKNINKAKAYCEKDYKKNKGREKIEWAACCGDGIQSQDLNFVMYSITPIKIID